MKPRRVFVLLELETVRSLRDLRNRALWRGKGIVHQVHANVVLRAKDRRKR